MLMADDRKFDLSAFQEIVESSFTAKQQLNDKEAQRLKVIYRLHVLRQQFLIQKSFCYLSVRYPAIVPIQLCSRQDGGLDKSAQWIRLVEIVKLVRLFQPESICEFGSGTSSAMFAMLCPNRVTTHEESEYWLNRLVKNIGEWKEKLNLVRADRVMQMKEEEAVCYYNIDHTRYFDFVYVDGPISEPPADTSHLKVKDPKGYMPNVDVELFWENGVFPKVILIDCRRATVRRLIQKGSPYYDVYLKSDLLINAHIPRFKGFLFHTVMIRKRIFDSGMRKK